MKSIIPAILVARALPQIEEPSNLLNLKINDGILITLPKVCTLRYPNHRNVDAKE